jgi:hypothetical protein
MRIDGSWYLCDDGVVRPVIRGKVQSADSSWIAVEFLVDTGADRTVFAAAALQTHVFPLAEDGIALEGVGGRADSIIVEACIALRDELQRDVLFRGKFAAFKDMSALDMSVLGRDILNSFAMIVVRPRDLVCLLSQRHSYAISVS